MRGTQNFEQIFSHLASPEPSGALLSSVLSRIQKERRRASVKRIIFFSFGLVMSALAFIPTWQTMRVSITRSGFWDFFSLLISDFGMVVSFGRSFVMVLLESLPVLSLFVFLALVFIFLGSLKYLVRDVKNIFTSARLIN